MTENLLPERFIDRPLKQFPSAWSNFISNFWPSAFDEGAFPAEFSTRGVRIYEENNHLHVEAPLPGLNPNEIDVSFNNGILLIKGESKQEEQDKKRKFYRSSKRSYSYSLALPAQIDEKQEPEAIYEDGILKVSLKMAKQDETKKITVKGRKK